MDPIEQSSDWPWISSENDVGHGSNTATEVIKGHWSAQEDSLLIELVKQHGVHNWSRIAERMGSRIGKQCRDRWINNLRPDLKHPDVPWTEEEERRLANGHKKFGNKWSLIAEMIPGRAENAIKNRWNTNVRKLTRKMNSSASDDHESSKRKFKRCKFSNLQHRVLPIPVPVITPTSDPSWSSSRFVGYDIDYVHHQLMSSISASISEEPTASGGGFDAQELPENLFEGFDVDELHELLNMDEGEGLVSTISASSVEESIGREGEFHVEEQQEALSEGYETDDIYHQLVSMDEFDFLASLPDTEAIEKQQQTIF